jgi:hypothetical protein
VRGWEGVATWANGALRREVFSFPSGGRRLFGSLYAPAAAAPPWGVVLCPSWGIEFQELLQPSHAFARQVVDAGGACLLYHPPGHGDSGGGLEDVSMGDLDAAATDAVQAAEARLPVCRWVAAGIRLGARAAIHAAGAFDSDTVVLIQPALRVDRFFEEMRSRTRRARLAAPLPGGDDGEEEESFGFPLPAPTDASQRSEIELRPGAGWTVGLVSHGQPDPVGEASVDPVVVPGRWRAGQDHAPLFEGALAWLRRSAS